MIKILHILQTFGIGGMESRVARLAIGLTGQEFQIHILTLRPLSGRSPALPPEVSVSLFEIESGIRLGRLMDLARYIKSNGFDIVHTHNWSTMLYGILAGKLARVPLVIHGEHGLNYQDLKGIPWKRAWAQTILAHLCDHVVPIHGQMSESLIKSWKMDPTKVTPLSNGVDLSKFKVGPSKGPEPEGSALGASSNEFVIGAVGRLDRVKNLPCLIKAVALLKARFPEKGGIRLVLVGEGPERAGLEMLADSLGVSDITNFIGDATEPEAWYAKFDVYVNSSFSEGMSNTLLEAMASGLPLVVSKIPGNISWVRENENALGFESDQEKDLAEKLATFKNDTGLRRKMGGNNRNRVETEFDNRFFLNKYEKLYRELMSRRFR